MKHSPIPFANPHAAYSERREEILRAVTQSLDSGWYILGAEVEQFEQSFARYTGTSHAIGCANGTDALELILRGLDIGMGKAVFTVSHTAVATVSAIERAGAVPVLVDVDPTTYTLCPHSLAEAIDQLVKIRPDLTPAAVIAVHIYGHPCDMDAITAIAQQYALHVIEDCAQAHGAKYRGCTAGAMGIAAGFSFYPTKNIGALGDAGGVITSDAALADTMRALRQYGWRDRYISATSGINSRLDPVQAAILSVQLQYAAEDTLKRQAIAKQYDAALAGMDIRSPHVAPWATHVYHLYVVQCAARDALIAHLRQHGIGTAVHYPMPVHLQPAYKDAVLRAPKGLPVTERLAQHIVSLPMYPQLTTDNLARVCEALQSFLEGGHNG